MLQEDTEYCYWQAKSLADTIIIIIITIISFGLFSRVSLRLIKYEIIEHYNKKRLIYLNLLIIIWAIVFIARKIYSIIIYFTILINGNVTDMTSYSIQFTKFKTLAGFLINSIFLQVFYLYYNGLLNWVEISQFTKSQHMLIRLFKIYYIIRLVKFPLEILIFIFAYSQYFYTIDFTNSMFIIIDGIITSIFLIASYRMFSKYFQIIKFSRQQDRKKLKFEYLMIILMNCFRVIMCILYVKEIQVFIMDYHQSDDRCYQEDATNHLTFTIVYNILGNILNHIVPIIWVMKIYDLKKSSILKVQKKIDRINHPKQHTRQSQDLLMTQDNITMQDSLLKSQQTME